MYRITFIEGGFRGSDAVHVLEISSLEAIARWAEANNMIPGTPARENYKFSVVNEGGTNFNESIKKLLVERVTV